MRTQRLFKEKEKKQIRDTIRKDNTFMPQDIIKEKFHRTKRAIRIKKKKKQEKQQQLLIEEFEAISQKAEQKHTEMKCI